VRYLTLSFAVGALRRGQGTEQFLGPADEDGIAAIRWVTIEPRGDRYRVAVHSAQDLGDELRCDLDSLPPLGVSAGEEYVGAGAELGLVAAEDDAIAMAERRVGARADLWVNFAVAGDEYADFIRARRSSSGADDPSDHGV
jgi:hypothetical protein